MEPMRTDKDSGGDTLTETLNGRFGVGLRPSSHGCPAMLHLFLVCTTSCPTFWSFIMIRLSSSICAALSAFLFAGSPCIQAAEIARYDDGPLAGKGGPFSESARVGDLLFLAGQIGENKDGNLVPGGIKAE